MKEDKVKFNVSYNLQFIDVDKDKKYLKELTELVKVPDKFNKTIEFDAEGYGSYLINEKNLFPLLQGKISKDEQDMYAKLFLEYLEKINDNSFRVELEKNVEVIYDWLETEEGIIWLIETFGKDFILGLDDNISFQVSTGEITVEYNGKVVLMSDIDENGNVNIINMTTQLMGEA